MRRRAVLPAALLAWLVTACAAGDGPTGGDGLVAPEEPVAAPVVEIVDLSFEGGAVTVTEGTTVTWTWQDAPVQHDVTFDDGVASPLQADGEWSRTFDEAGTYAYGCSTGTPTGSSPRTARSWTPSRHGRSRCWRWSAAGCPTTRSPPASS